MSRTKRWPGRNRSFGLPLNCTKTYKWGCSASAARQARGQLPGNGGQATDPAGAIHRLALWVGGLSTVGVMDKHPPSVAPGATSWVCADSEALPHPSGSSAIACHVGSDALADVGSRPERSGSCHCMVASRANIGAGQLVALAKRHPVQRHECYLQRKEGLILDMVASSTHERLRIDRCASRECKGQVILLERLVAMLVFANVAWMPYRA